MRFIITLIFLVLFTPKYAFCQTADDIKLASGLIKAPQYEEHYKMHKGEKNVLKVTSRALFVFYKNFISSQDGGHCSFYPSCSVYAMNAIQKKGFITGLLAAFDRLSRCNGLSPDKYPLKKGTLFLYDPVD
jgi:uncharacterized protein